LLPYCVLISSLSHSNKSSIVKKNADSSSKPSELTQEPITVAPLPRFTDPSTLTASISDIQGSSQEIDTPYFFKSYNPSHPAPVEDLYSEAVTDQQQILQIVEIKPDQTGLDQIASHDLATLTDQQSGLRGAAGEIKPRLEPEPSLKLYNSPHPLKIDSKIGAIPLEIPLLALKPLKAPLVQPATYLHPLLNSNSSLDIAALEPFNYGRLQRRRLECKF
jgi:hypothetical protein